MTLSAWLRERTPAPPPLLAARVDEVLGDALHGSADEAGARCVDAAEQLLRDLLARPSAGRESALDLLTVDALVTYAFEAASSDPATMSALAAQAVARFAAVAHE